MKSFALFAATAALLLPLTGCQTNVNTVSRAEPLARPNFVNDKRVVTDRSLGELIGVVSVNETIVSGNLRKVQVTLENLRDNNREIRYRFEWVDQDGMAVGGVSELWLQLVLAGRETRSVSTVATSPRAADFTLKIVEGK
jgi:uncharacterized protein YcfL